MQPILVKKNQKLSSQTNPSKLAGNQPGSKTSQMHDCGPSITRASVCFEDMTHEGVGTAQKVQTLLTVKADWASMFLNDTNLMIIFGSIFKAILRSSGKGILIIPPSANTKMSPIEDNRNLPGKSDSQATCCIHFGRMTAKTPSSKILVKHPENLSILGSPEIQKSFDQQVWTIVDCQSRHAIWHYSQRKLFCPHRETWLLDLY